MYITVVSKVDLKIDVDKMKEAKDKDGMELFQDGTFTIGQTELSIFDEEGNELSDGDMGNEIRQEVLKLLKGEA